MWKELLCKKGMMKDKLGLIQGVESEISLIYKDDINYFLVVNKTHPVYSTRGSKGGLTKMKNSNPSYPHAGKQVIENSYHTTGTYGFTFAGEPLPPLII